MRLSIPPSGSFAVFPYLRTSEPVHLCGFELHPSSSISHLPTVAQEYWQTLSAMFYLRDKLRIINPTYIYLSPEQDADRADVAEALKKLHVCLGYIMTSPFTPDRTPFLRWEHTSLFWLRPALISKHVIWQEYGTENELPIEKHPSVDEGQDVAGYRGLLNDTEDIEVVMGSRIYPPVRGLWFNVNQDLVSDIEGWRNRTANWALQVFFERQEPFLSRDAALTNRILNSVGWYNRSTSLMLSEDTALLYLAIAFEALLNLEDGKGVTERFKETVQTLLGPIERLHWWADQFYTARSKIVHRGGWPHLGFYTVEPKEHNDIIAGRAKTERRPYGRLLSYGRHVFRLCAQSIIHAPVLAWQTHLSETLVNNEDRLKRLCENLKDSSKSANDRLQEVCSLIAGFHEFGFIDDTTVQAGTLAGAAKRLCEVYIELSITDLPVEIEAVIKQLVAKGTVQEHMEHIQTLAELIDEWKGPQAPHTRYGLTEAQKSDPISVVWSFCDYFRFKAFYLRH